MRTFSLTSVLFLALSIPFSGRAQYCQEGRFGPVDTLFSAEEVMLDFDLEYGRAVGWLGDTVSLRLDVYQPSPIVDTLSQRPVIVYLHGGGFHAGSKSNEKGRVWARDFVRRGYVFVAVDYRIGWPSEDSCAADTAMYMRAVYRAVQDTKAALRWLVEYQETWRIDTTQIYLLGTSAGSGASMFAAYSLETDLGAYLSEELGPLDGSGNDFHHPFQVAGIITKAAAIDDLAVLERREIPHLLFHGTCDLTVPYTHGAIFHCYAPDKFVDAFGSGDIAEEFSRLGRCYTLYKNIGQGHGAVDDDTAVIYTAAFIRSLLCGECETVILERISKADVCADRSGKTSSVELLYPNPNSGSFMVVISGPRDEVIDLELYDISGRLMRRDQRQFIAPVQQWLLNWTDLEAGMYFFKTGVMNRFTVRPVVIHPSALSDP